MRRTVTTHGDECAECVHAAEAAEGLMMCTGSRSVTHRTEDSEGEVHEALAVQ